jgi:hypothetical protein
VRFVAAGQHVTDKPGMRGIMMLPFYAGMGPYPALVDDESWVRANLTVLKEDGPEQYLVNLLAVLRAAMAPEE